MRKRVFLLIVASIYIFILSCGKEKKIVVVQYAPVLYDLVAPDSLQRGSPGLSYMFISAFDPDGPEDIDSVYFISTRPDSTTTGEHFYLHDDGQYGDSVANDGRYSVGITAPDTSSQLGDFTFTFYAFDKEGNRSNNPVHYVTAY